MARAAHSAEGYLTLVMFQWDSDEAMDVFSETCVLSGEQKFLLERWLYQATEDGLIRGGWYIGPPQAAPRNGDETMADIRKALDQKAGR